MNALYDFFLTPQPKDSNKTRYHARLVVRDTITLEDIAETIESRSSLRQSDVIGSFIEFANVFKQELSNGNSIHIPGVGSFRIKARSTFSQRNPCRKYSLQWNRFYSGKRFASRIKGYNF